MPTITVKNIPDKIYKTLKKQASANHRSINSEIIHIIENATISTRIDPAEHLLSARNFRAKTGNIKITEEDINYAKNEDRS